MNDLNDLNKNQIVLLTLLVSFVTSIATGIVTVTLIEQAPPSVIQPVNRVILKTVERVVTDGNAKPVIREVPVIVTEEQLIIKVINNAAPAVVTIAGAAPGTTTVTTLGVGFIVSGDLVVTSPHLLNLAVTSYQLTLADKKQVTADLVSASTSPVAVLKIKDGGEFPALSIDNQDIAVGQTVVALGSAGGEENTVAVGIVSGATRGPGEGAAIQRVRTSAANLDNAGGPILNIHGKVVGLVDGPGTAVAQTLLRQAIDAAKK